MNVLLTPILTLSLLGLLSAPTTAASPTVPSTSFAQNPEEQAEPAESEEADASEDEGEKDDDDKADDAPTPLLIKGGDVHLGDGRVLRRASVLLENGKISAIGHDVEAPDDVEIVDATGKVVAPGFVIPLITSGFGIPRNVDDGVADEVNPFDPQLKMALAAGITSVMAKGNPGRDKPAGTSHLIKMFPGDVERMGSGPANTVVSMRTPLSPSDMRDFEKLVADTRKYLVEKAAFDAKQAAGPAEEAAKPADEAKKEGEKGGDGKPARGRGRRGGNDKKKPEGPKPPRGSEGLIRVLEGEARLWVIGGRSSMDETALRQGLEIAALLRVGVVLDRPTTAWVDPEPIARTGSMALLNTRVQERPDPARPNETGSNTATAAILHEAGVPFAVTCPGAYFGGQDLGLNGLLGSDLHTPFMDAAFAVRGGLPGRAALRTLTIDSARILGVEDRVGSIEVGKDADILLLDGDPLHYKTFVETAIVDGRVVYVKSEEPFYSHIKR